MGEWWRHVEATNHEKEKKGKENQSESVPFHTDCASSLTTGDSELETLYYPSSLGGQAGDMEFFLQTSTRLPVLYATYIVICCSISTLSSRHALDMCKVKPHTVSTITQHQWVET